MYELRTYQREASNIAVQAMLSNRNGMIVIPTGGGKSLILADIAYRLNKPLLVFQPSKEILEQNYNKLLSYGVRDCSIYSASFNSKEISRITYATIQSVMNHKEDFDCFQYVVVDECFPYGQFVSTEFGQMRIGRLANMHKRGEALPRVLSYNEKTKKCEPKKITRAWSTGIRDVKNFFFSNNIRVRCTENHPFLTPDGWKEIGSLKVGDCILSNKKGHGYANIPNKDQIDFILGSIVGDGSIEKRDRVKNIYRFRFTQGEKQFEYLKWKESLLGCEGSIYRGKSGFCNNKVFFFNSHVLYFNDEMCSKKFAIEHLTPRSLAIIWMDDGHIGKDQNQGTICDIAESPELTELFAKKLNGMGIDCIACKSVSSLTKKPYNFIRLRKNGVERLCEIIAPFVHKSMDYKLTDKVKNLAGSYKWNKDYGDYTACVLTKIENVGKRDVFNIEVEDNHSYVITTGKYKKDSEEYPGGLIVHNCQNVNSKVGQYKDFIESKNRTVLGLTATPYRLDRGYNGGAILKFLTRTRPRIFEELLYAVQISDLLEQGYLADLKYYDITSIDLSRVLSNSTGADYDDDSLKKEYIRCGYYDKLTTTVLRVLNPKSGKQRSGVLVFTKFIEESLDLVRKLRSNGVQAAIVTGNTPKTEREIIIDRFRRGIIKVVSNVGTLTTGFDYPELDTVILARPTKSLGLYYQMIGRVIRPFTDKEGWVIDLCGSYRRFGKVSDLKIDVEKPFSKRYCIKSNGIQLTNIEF